MNELVKSKCFLSFFHIAEVWLGWDRIKNRWWYTLLDNFKIEKLRKKKQILNVNFSLVILYFLFYFFSLTCWNDQKKFTFKWKKRIRYHLFTCFWLSRLKNVHEKCMLLMVLSNPLPEISVFLTHTWSCWFNKRKCNFGAEFY